MAIGSPRSSPGLRANRAVLGQQQALEARRVRRQALVVRQRHRRRGGHRGLGVRECVAQLAGDAQAACLPERIAQAEQCGAAGARELGDDAACRGRIAAAQRGDRRSEDVVAVAVLQRGLQARDQRPGRRDEQTLDVRFDAFGQAREVAQRLLGRVDRFAALAPEEGQILGVDVQQLRDVAGAGRGHRRGPRPGEPRVR
ncbi:MAG: hypothetical protein U1F49_13245 [Rubrivivax sp.]